MKRDFICISCPLGCNITAELDGKNILSITGNTCEKGEDYVTKELTNPSRTVTSTVAVSGGEGPVVAVRTLGEIPKDKIMECMAKINQITLSAPVKMGDVIIENVCDTGIDVVATAEMKKM